MNIQVPTVSELIVEGFSEGGFRSEHAVAVAIADASPKLLSGCKKAIAILTTLPHSKENQELIALLNEAVNQATTQAARLAS